MAPGGEQQVREDEDYKNTSRQLVLVLPTHSVSVCGGCSLPATVPQDVEECVCVCMCMCVCVCVCVCACPHTVHQHGVFL